MFFSFLCAFFWCRENLGFPSANVHKIIDISAHVRKIVKKKERPRHTWPEKERSMFVGNRTGQCQITLGENNPYATRVSHFDGAKIRLFRPLGKCELSTSFPLRDVCRKGNHFSENALTALLPVNMCASLPARFNVALRIGHFVNFR